MKSWLALAAAVVVVAFVGAPAHATVVVVPSLDEMTRKSDVIVHAVVVDQRVERQHNRTVTLTDLRVTESIKGAHVDDVVTVYQVGGTLDGKRSWIVGAHEYQKGEDLVLFALDYKFGPRPMVVSYGVGVGIFDVVTDANGPHVVESMNGIDTLERTGSGTQAILPPRPRSFTTLTGFLDTVRALVAGAGKPQAPRLDVIEPAPLQQKTR